MIIGWWYINAFLRYIRIQVREIIKGISDPVVTTNAFYIIPEEEVI